ncbi:MAG: TRAP transporter small permease [Lachnospiraceae bacterium]|nr:TRAP transporter small permease [Lachnospiraceae bacterium]
MKLRKELDEISEIIDKVVSILCVILTFLMFLSVLYQIIGRYLIRTSIAWTEEAARYCMIWLAFLGASMLVRSGENSSVTFLKDRFSKKLRDYLELAIQAVMLAFMAVIFFLSLSQVRYSMNEISPALRISMFIPKSSILFGSLIVSFQLLWKLLDTALSMFWKGGNDT